MPKRPNPFADLYAPQLKTHVGIKEVNMGVNSEYNMKIIYERTQDLLHQGAKKQFYETSCDIVCKITKPNNWLLQLQKEKSDLSNSVEKNFSPVASQSALLCLFCDRPINANSHRVCELCKGDFCNLCSMLRYDQQEETAICLSCL